MIRSNNIKSAWLGLTVLTVWIELMQLCLKQLQLLQAVCYKEYNILIHVLIKTRIYFVPLIQPILIMIFQQELNTYGRIRGIILVKFTPALLQLPLISLKLGIQDCLDNSLQLLFQVQKGCINQILKMILNIYVILFYQENKEILKQL